MKTNTIAEIKREIFVLEQLVENVTLLNKFIKNKNKMTKLGIDSKKIDDVLEANNELLYERKKDLDKLKKILTLAMAVN